MLRSRFAFGIHFNVSMKYDIEKSVPGDADFVTGGLMSALYSFRALLPSAEAYPCKMLRMLCIRVHPVRGED